MRPTYASGFTLLETLVAVSIVAVAVSGPLVTASRAIVAAETARDKLTASYLAQEGVEYVRLMRDNEYLTIYNLGVSGVSSAAWNNFTTGGNPTSITECVPNECALDTTRSMGSPATGGTSLQPCSGAGCNPLYPSASGVYSFTVNPSYTGTLFRRTVQATRISSEDEKIVSKVWWTFRGTSYTVTIVDHLTPWQ